MRYQDHKGEVIDDNFSWILLYQPKVYICYTWLDSPSFFLVKYWYLSNAINVLWIHVVAKKYEKMVES